MIQVIRKLFSLAFNTLNVAVSDRERLISTAALTEWCNYVAEAPRQNTDDAIERTVQIFRQHPLSESVLHEKKIATMQELGEGGARAVFTQAATTDDL